MHNAGPKQQLHHYKLLSRQVAVAVQQVYKCPPCRNETRPCIRRLTSRLNRTCRSSSTETLDLLTCDCRTKVQILVRL